ncbi:MAG: signal peptidase I [Lachnospiraceae bacterium]
MKRVIGLPGETVQIKNGQIYIDDKPLEADKGLGQVSLAGLAENPVVLEEDEYFLLGDNRDSSEDSSCFRENRQCKTETDPGKVWLETDPVSH